MVAQLRPVVFAEKATEELQAIFKFWECHTSRDLAQRIIDQIIRRAIKLSSPFDNGIIDSSLNKEEKTYRFVIMSHWKIVFFISEELVTISSIFDTRRDLSNL